MSTPPDSLKAAKAELAHLQYEAKRLTWVHAAFLKSQDIAKIAVMRNHTDEFMDIKRASQEELMELRCEELLELTKNFPAPPPKEVEVVKTVEVVKHKIPEWIIFAFLGIQVVELFTLLHFIK